MYKIFYYYGIDYNIIFEFEDVFFLLLWEYGLVELVDGGDFGNCFLNILLREIKLGIR